MVAGSFLQSLYESMFDCCNKPVSCKMILTELNDITLAKTSQLKEPVGIVINDVSRLFLCAYVNKNPFQKDSG